MNHKYKLTIRKKIIGLLIFYFLVALFAIGSTLFVSWQLEGSAAAINDAGRERMRSYRIAFLLSQKEHLPSTELLVDIKHEIMLFENTLKDLEFGNPQRSLSLPEDAAIQAQMIKLRQTWYSDIKPRIRNILESSDKATQERLLTEYRPSLESYVAEINALVIEAEHANARATKMLRFLQVALVSLALLGTVLLVYLFTLMVVRPVTQLRTGIQRMANADFDVRLPVVGNDELSDLASGFNSMAAELKDIYSTLERRVEKKTKSIEAKNRKLAALDKEMAVSEERNLLAQELHDSIAQSLAFLSIQVQMLQEDLQKNRTVEALEGLAQIREGVQESYDDVRELLVHFRTRIGSADIATAIRSALEKFEGQTGIKTTFMMRDSVPELQPEHVLQIMHIVQEALSNVRKHAKANHVQVEMRKNGKYLIDIQDNGVGFDTTIDAGDTHIGLRIMRERAHRIKAELSFESMPDKGTHIYLKFAENMQEGESV